MNKMTKDTIRETITAVEEYLKVATEGPRSGRGYALDVVTNDLRRIPDELKRLLDPPAGIIPKAKLPVKTEKALGKLVDDEGWVSFLMSVEPGAYGDIDFMNDQADNTLLGEDGNLPGSLSDIGYEVIDVEDGKLIVLVTASAADILQELNDGE